MVISGRLIFPRRHRNRRIDDYRCEAYRIGCRQYQLALPR